VAPKSGQETPQPELTPVARRERPAPAPERLPTVQRIETPDVEETKHQTLVEASDAARRRKEAGDRPGAPIAVITDQNLKSFSQKGELTTASPDQPAEAPSPSFDEDSEEPESEQHWREQALDLRLSWQRVLDERRELENQAAELRRRFYSEDDPFVRDRQVKPDWDRVLDRISGTKIEEQRIQRELDDLYEEAAAAAVDLSWLEEGSELEPVEAEDEEGGSNEFPIHLVREPALFDEDPP
jgi:hypothetical protein